MAMKKETVKIVIIGHVDHGKSTLIGRLLLDTKSLPRERMAEIRKISRELGKDAELAFLTDQLKEEREQSITIDTTQIFFQTRKKNYCIIDTPGHVEFLKNMLSGASLARAAVLIVDVKEGVMEQTRRHSYLIKMLGLDKAIVVFNKMDLVGYQEERFEEVKTGVLGLLESLRIEAGLLIPISAREGINVSRGSSKLTWYKGPSLLVGLDSLRLDARTMQGPLRLPIQDVYEIGSERIIVGRVASGTVKRGQDIILLPSMRVARINAIKASGGDRREAGAGESIGLTLDESLSVERGEVIAHEENMPGPAKRFRGNIFWMSHEPLQIGRPMTLRCATQSVRCVAERIEKRIDSSTLEVLEEDARELRLNEAGEVMFKTDEPIVVERFDLVEELGRFVIEREYDVEGAGIVTGRETE